MKNYIEFTKWYQRKIKMKKLFEYEYKSGKKIELSIREDKSPIIIIKEYNKGKIVKDFFTTLTALTNLCYKYENKKKSK